MQKCPACGAKCDDNLKFCTSCGAELLEIAGDIIVCPHCGKLNTDSDILCAKCGNKLNSEPSIEDNFTPAVDNFTNMPEMKTCPNCGAQNSAAARFCNFCGTDLVNPVKADDSRKSNLRHTANSEVVEKKAASMQADPNLANAEKPVISKRNFAVIAVACVLVVLIAVLIIFIAIGNGNKNFNGKTLSTVSAYLDKKEIPIEVVYNETPSYALGNDANVVSFASVTDESIETDKFDKDAEKIILYVQGSYIEISAVEKIANQTSFDEAYCMTIKNNYTSMLTNIAFSAYGANEKDKKDSDSFANSVGCYCASGDTAVIRINYTNASAKIAICEITLTFEDGTTQLLTGSLTYSTEEMGSKTVEINEPDVTNADGEYSLTNNLSAEDCIDCECNFRGKVKTRKGGDLNLRSSASTKADIVASIPTGTALAFTEISNGFGYCTYGGKNGWVSLDYIECSYKAVTDTDVFSTAGSGADKCGTLSGGSAVSFDYIENGYGHISTGFVLLTSITSNY